MNLRTRLALTVLAVVVPIAVGARWVRADAEARAMDAALNEEVLASLEGDEQARCEAAPARWQGPRCGTNAPGRTVFVYDHTLRPAREGSPPVDAAWRRRIARGAVVLGRRRDEGGETGYEALVRVPGTPRACAFVLVRRENLPSLTLRGGVPFLPPRFLPVVVMLGVMLLALGPLVARIRRLTRAVRRSAAERYVRPVAVEGDDEVAALAQAFNEAAAEVRSHVAQQESRERALREFLENTTHDLAIPLTVLQGHLSAIGQRVRAGESVSAESIAAAMDEAQYMASLAHNLTAAARLESAAPTAERVAVELTSLVGRVVARHRPVAAQRGIELESGVPPEALSALGDVTLLEQALSNVVHNAIRYNREGGHVAVLLEDEAAGRFRLRVLDDGPGMTAADLGRLSQRRARGEQARSRHPEGFGLGLDIARRVADTHGWTMTLGASEYGGLEVVFVGDVAD